MYNVLQLNTTTKQQNLSTSITKVYFIQKYDIVKCVSIVIFGHHEYNWVLQVGNSKATQHNIYFFVRSCM